MQFVLDKLVSLGPLLNCLYLEKTGSKIKSLRGEEFTREQKIVAIRTGCSLTRLMIPDIGRINLSTHYLLESTISGITKRECIKSSFGLIRLKSHILTNSLEDLLNLLLAKGVMTLDFPSTKGFGGHSLTLFQVEEGFNQEHCALLLESYYCKYSLQAKFLTHEALTSLLQECVNFLCTGDIKHWSWELLESRIEAVKLQILVPESKVSLITYLTNVEMELRELFLQNTDKYIENYVNTN